MEGGDARRPRDVGQAADAGESGDQKSASRFDDAPSDRDEAEGRIRRSSGAIHLTDDRVRQGERFFFQLHRIDASRTLGLSQQDAIAKQSGSGNRSLSEMKGYLRMLFDRGIVERDHLAESLRLDQKRAAAVAQSCRMTGLVSRPGVEERDPRGVMKRRPTPISHFIGAGVDEPHDVPGLGAVRSDVPRRNFAGPPLDPDGRAPEEPPNRDPRDEPGRAIRPNLVHRFPRERPRNRENSRGSIEFTRPAEPDGCPPPSRRAGL